MKLMLDTNIILDYLLQRQPHFHDSRTVTLLGLFQDTQNYICAHTITDVNYILCKTYGSARAQEIIEKDLDFLKLAPITQTEISNALARRWNDFEGAVVSTCAETIRADFIITRNEKDFKLSKIRALSPTDYLSWLKLNNIVCDVVSFT